MSPVLEARRSAARCLAPAALAWLGLAAAACAPDSTRAREIIVDQEPQVVLSRARPGVEHQSGEIVVAGANALGVQVLPDRTGVESGVRANRDGRRIVFVRTLLLDDPTSRELFVATLDGSAPERRLTIDRHRDEDPCWTSDGSQIVFSSDRGGTFGLWRIDADGQNPTPLFTAPADDHEPDCAAGMLAFRRGAQVFLATETGAGARVISDGAMPALSPDGRQLAFVSGPLVLLLNLETLVVRQLTNPAEVAGGGDRSPRFTPTGDRLLLLRSSPGLGLGVDRPCSLALDGSNPVVLFPADRFVATGFDALPTLPAWPALGPEKQAALPGSGLGVFAGVRTLGRPEEMQEKDGHVFGVTSETLDGRQLAAVGARAELTELPTQYTVTVTASLSRTGSQIRIGLFDAVTQRYDVVLEAAPQFTSLQTWTFTTSSLAHVDRDRRVWLEVIADFGPGGREELRVDHVGVTWRR